MDSKLMNKFIKNISWWKVIIFGGLLFIALFIFIFLRRGDISGSDILVSIQGPDTFKAQESVEFEIKLANKSKIELSDAVLFAIIPDFLSFEGFDGVEQRIDIGVVPPHSEMSRKIVLFSTETNMHGAIKARVEYSPKNLRGRFESSAEKEISASSLPLTVIFDILQEAVSGQRIRGIVHFVSDEVIKASPLFVKLVLPDNFTFEDAEPVPFEDTIWRFDGVEAGETNQLEFEGIIMGDENEDKKFEILFGNLKSNGDFVVQHSIFKTVNISSSPVDFEQVINGENEYIASPGEKINFSIKYVNKSGVDIEDVAITTQLAGDIFNFGKLDAGLGYFNKNTKTIVWNKNFLESLKMLSQGDAGEVNFSIFLKNDIAPRNYKDKNVYGISRAVIESSKVPLALGGLSLRKDVESKIKIRTHIALSTKAYYYEGPFSNSGPIPPRVGEKTTYTVLWQVANSLNDADGVKIEAPLPRHVAFDGEAYPPKDNFQYNENTHSVSWDVGALSSGIGSIFPVETVAFQVSVTPDDNMRGQTFELIEQSKISGTDTFTGEFLEEFAPQVDSSLPDDIGIQDGDGIVQ